MESVDYKKEYEELIGLWYEAKAAYDQEADKAKGARKALRIFGITRDGKKQDKIPKGKFFSEYQTRLAELPPIERTTAEKQNIINDMAEKNGGMKPSTLIKYLKDMKAMHQKAIKDLYHSQGYKVDEDTFKKIDFWDEHFLPPRK